MAIRIPTYDRQVGITTPNIPAAPNPGAVRGAFGEDVFRANQQIGQTVGNIGEALGRHLYEQKQIQDNAQTAQLETGYRRAVNDKSSNDRMETVKINGQDVQRPEGWFNRQGKQTYGLKDEYTKYTEDLKRQYVQKAPSKEMAIKLGQQIDEYNTSMEQKIVSHQAKEWRNTQLKSQIANLAQQEHDADSIREPKDLIVGIKNAMNTADQISAIQRVDPVKADKNRKDRVGDIVSKAVNSTFNETGDLKKAQNLLNSSKDYLDEKRYESLHKVLKTGDEQMLRNQQRVAVQKYITSEADYLTRLASGQMSWMNADDVAKDVRSGAIPEKFGAAYIDVLESKGDLDLSNENKNYPQFVDSIYKAKDQEELHAALLNILQDHKNISQEKMSVLINGAMQRSGNLPISTRLGDEKQVNPAQQELDSGAMAVTNFGRRTGMTNNQIADIYQNFQSAVAKGGSVKDAYDMAVHAHAVDQFPAAATMEEPPNLVIHPDGNIKAIFPQETNVFPSRIWDGKQFVVNPDREQGTKSKPKAKK